MKAYRSNLPIYDPRESTNYECSSNAKSEWRIPVLVAEDIGEIDHSLEAYVIRSHPIDIK